MKLPKCAQPDCPRTAYSDGYCYLHDPHAAAEAKADPSPSLLERWAANDTGTIGVSDGGGDYDAEHGAPQWAEEDAPDLLGAAKEALYAYANSDSQEIQNRMEDLQAAVEKAMAAPEASMAREIALRPWREVDALCSSPRAKWEVIKAIQKVARSQIEVPSESPQGSPGGLPEGVQLVQAHEKALQAFINSLRAGGHIEAGRALDATRAALVEALAARPKIEGGEVESLRARAEAAERKLAEWNLLVAKSDRIGQLEADLAAARARIVELEGGQP